MSLLAGLAGCGRSSQGVAYDEHYLFPSRPLVPRQVSSHAVRLPDALTVAPGQTVTLADLEGPGVIRRYWMAMPLTRQDGYLRKLVLRAYWDGEASPSVEVPLGDFFGEGLVRSYPVFAGPFGRSAGALYSHWEMPFHRSARLTIENQSDVDLGLFYQVFWTQEQLPEGVMTFHAQWRQEAPTILGKDYLALRTQGKGRYLGLTMTMQGAYEGQLGYLEGDESIILDRGTKRETVLRGTGLEDYFNGGYYWSQGGSQLPTHGLILGNSEKSHYAAYRLHLPDPIYFQDSLEVWFEHGNSYNAEKVTYATTAFWYQEEPHTPFPPLPPVEERLSRPAQPPFRYEGAFEAEAHMPLIRKYRTTTYNEDVSEFAVAIATQVIDGWDTEGYTFPLDVPTTGTFEIGASWLPTLAGGRWQLRHGENLLGEPFETWGPEPLYLSPTSLNSGSGLHQLATLYLEPGETEFRFTLDGIHPKATRQHLRERQGRQTPVEAGALILDALTLQGPLERVFDAEELHGLALVSSATLELVEDQADPPVLVWTQGNKSALEFALPVPRIEATYQIALRLAPGRTVPFRVAADNLPLNPGLPALSSPLLHDADLVSASFKATSDTLRLSLIPVDESSLPDRPQILLQTILLLRETSLPPAKPAVEAFDGDSLSPPANLQDVAPLPESLRLPDGGEPPPVGSTDPAEPHGPPQPRDRDLPQRSPERPR